MAKFSIDSLWKPSPKAALAPVAELQKAETEWSEKRGILLKEHEELSNGILTDFHSGGTAKVQLNQQRMRDIEVELQICDSSLVDLRGRIEEATAREADEKLKAEAEQWAIDSKKEWELRDKALKQAVELFATLTEHREARRKGEKWRSVIGKADALGLKPVDAQSVALAQKHVGRQHPVTDNALFERLRNAAGFNDLLQEFGIPG